MSIAIKNEISQVSEGVDFLYEVLWTRVYSYVFEISIKTPLFRTLAHQPLTLQGIADVCELEITSARVLAQYLCGLKLISMQDGLFYPTPVAAAYLTNPDIIRDLSGFAPESLAAFEARLRNVPQQPWYQIRNSNESVTGVSGMNLDFFIAETRHNWRIAKGKELSMAYDFTKHTHLMDIGGASGGWCVGVRSENPHLECTIYDLPEVAGIVSRAAEKLGHDDKINIVTGNIFNNELPDNADVVLLANVLHDWSEADCLFILKKVYDSLPENGVVLIYEFFLNNDWTGPLGSMYQAITVLGPTGESGWQPSYIEMEQLLAAAGFVTEPGSNNLVVGKKC
jgi:3-hydroxy-5-methyl-1-naphthoate 3-O-methyltransferase